MAFAAKNTIILVGLSQIPTIEDAKKISSGLTKLGQAIFYNLIGGEQIVYQGEGQNWKGKVIINYYNHFWTDDMGVLKYDGWKYRAMPQKDDVYTVTVKWNNQQESFELKASQ